MESWKRFINENKEIWKAEKLDKKAKGKVVYRLVHVPSGKTIPVQYYDGSAKNVKDLVNFLKSKNWDDIESSNPSKKTLKSVHDTIVKSKYKNPNYEYNEAEEK